jgi:hypothetical protein
VNKSNEMAPMRLQPYVWGLLGFWTFVVAIFLGWSLILQKNATMESATIAARSHFEKDVLFRRWNSQHGVIYGPITEKTPPNPYLSHLEERDIKTPAGRGLTIINPAYMTRQVYELAKHEHQILGNIISLNPIRPENAPDSWEKEALEAFNHGTAEVISVQEIYQSSYLRLMRPLITEQSCLKCHAGQGYNVGDIRGGISVALPISPFWAAGQRLVIFLYLGHMLMWLLGCAGIYLGARRLEHYLKTREAAEENLLRANEDLQGALDQVKTLKGLLPICASCKKIRDDRGYWQHVETYIRDRSEAEFSHSICPDCFKKLYPEFCKDTSD